MLYLKKLWSKHLLYRAVGILAVKYRANPQKLGFQQKKQQP